MMANGDPEGRDSFSCSPLTFILKVLEYAKMQCHMIMSLDLTLASMCANSYTSNEQVSRDSLGKIAGVR